MIRTKILPYFENLPLSEIDTAAVMKWQTELMNYRNPKTGNPYAQTYLRQIHNQLSTIFNFAVKYYGLLRNPAQLCGSMGKQNAEKFDFWTYDEFQQFIRTTEDNMPVRTIFSLFFYSGMREGELLALTLNDFDFEKGTVSISKSLAVIKGEAVVKATKTPKSNRVIALPQPIMDMVQEYANALYKNKPTNRLFQTSKHSLFRAMQTYCKKSGVRKIRVHELRHSHASHLIELGVSPLTISERLGHEDIKTRSIHTRTCTQTSRPKLRKCLQNMCRNRDWYESGTLRIQKSPESLAGQDFRAISFLFPLKTEKRISRFTPSISSFYSHIFSIF